MKRLYVEINDANALEELGRASIQIVHDLKNQLNGLKLYATFLRKRMEVSDRPLDEQETIGKLIAGLERAAADMTTLVRYGRPVELRRQTPTDLVRLLRTAGPGDDVIVESAQKELKGMFDVSSMTEALTAITSYSCGAPSANTSEKLRIQLTPDSETNEAVIEWQGVRINNGDDPFRSLAGSEGIRMSLARKIIEAHGGRAEVSDALLRVRLPLDGPA